MALKNTVNLNENTTNAEFLELLNEARQLPADGKIYERGDIKMKHNPSTRLKLETVYVLRYGVIRRSALVNGKWTRPDQPAAWSEFE
jgi:hypothetical protein